VSCLTKSARVLLLLFISSTRRQVLRDQFISIKEYPALYREVDNFLRSSKVVFIFLVRIVYLPNKWLVCLSPLFYLRSRYLSTNVYAHPDGLDIIATSPLTIAHQIPVKTVENAIQTIKDIFAFVSKVRTK